MSAPEPDRTFTTPAGSTLGEDLARTRGRVSGVRADGLRTTVLPVASAGPSFQRRHVERVVPRRDRGDDADRVAPDDRGVAGEELVRGEAVHHPRGAGEEPEQVGADGDLVDRGADRLAGVGRSRAGRARRRRASSGVGDLEEHQASDPAASSASTSRTPSRPRRPPGRRPPAASPARCAMTWSLAGLIDVERLARRRVDELAADELLVGLDALERVGHRGASCCGGATRLLAAIRVVTCSSGLSAYVTPLRKTVPAGAPRGTPRTTGSSPARPRRRRRTGRCSGRRQQDRREHEVGPERALAELHPDPEPVGRADVLRR